MRAGLIEGQRPLSTRTIKIIVLVILVTLYYRYVVQLRLGQKSTFKLLVHDNCGVCVILDREVYGKGRCRWIIVDPKIDLRIEVCYFPSKLRCTWKSTRRDKCYLSIDITVRVTSESIFFGEVRLQAYQSPVSNESWVGDIRPGDLRSVIEALIALSGCDECFFIEFVKPCTLWLYRLSVIPKRCMCHWYFPIYSWPKYMMPGYSVHQ